MRNLKFFAIGLWALTAFPVASWAAPDDWSPISCGESTIRFSDNDVCQSGTVEDRSRDGSKFLVTVETNIHGDNGVFSYDITQTATKYSRNYFGVRTPNDRVHIIKHYNDVTESSTDMSGPFESGDDLSVRFSKNSLKCVGLHRNGGQKTFSSRIGYSWIESGYVCLKNHPDAITDAEVNGLLASIKTSD